MCAIEDRAERVRGVGVKRVTDVVANESGRFEQASEDRQGSRKAAVRFWWREGQVGRDPVVAAERLARTGGSHDQELNRIPRLADRVRYLREERRDGLIPNERHGCLNDGALVLEVVVDGGRADAESHAPRARMEKSLSSKRTRVSRATSSLVRCVVLPAAMRAMDTPPNNVGFSNYRTSFTNTVNAERRRGRSCGGLTSTHGPSGLLPHWSTPTGAVRLPCPGHS